MPKGKPSLQELRMGLRQVPARSPKAGASLRRVEARSRASGLGVAPHAKTLRVRELHTITSDHINNERPGKGHYQYFLK